MGTEPEVEPFAQFNVNDGCPEPISGFMIYPSSGCQKITRFVPLSPQNDSYTFPKNHGDNIVLLFSGKVKTMKALPGRQGTRKNLTGWGKSYSFFSTGSLTNGS